MNGSQSKVLMRIEEQMCVVNKVFMVYSSKEQSASPGCSLKKKQDKVTYLTQSIFKFTLIYEQPG